MWTEVNFLKKSISSYLSLVAFVASMLVFGVSALQLKLKDVKN